MYYLILRLIQKISSNFLLIIRYTSIKETLQISPFLPFLRGAGKDKSKRLICLLIGGSMAAIATLIAIFGVAAPAFAQDINPQGFNPQELIRSSLQWVENLGVWGGVAFIGIYILSTIAFLPASILTLAAGGVFGVVWGSIYVFVGATLGAIAAFLVGRYLIRGWVSKKIAGNQKFMAIDTAVAQEGLKIVFLTRLSPVFPFNLLNYAFGVTGVTLRDYGLGSIGMIPGTIMYVYIGSLAGDIAKIGTESQPTDRTIQWIINIIGLIATIAVTVFITRLATKALGSKIDDPNQP